MKKKITALILALALCAALPLSASAFDMGKPGYYSKFSMGLYHSAVIDANGDLYTAGSNEEGQLGLGDNTHRNTLTKVPGLSNVVTVSLGSRQSAALTADGSLYTWGWNKYGMLGLGNSGKGTDINKPAKVGLSNVTAVSFGTYHSAAITEDGSLYTWGWNEYGQLGLGDSGEGTDRSTPTKVPGISNVVAISLGNCKTAAITAEGSLYTWGENRGLGFDSSENKSMPTKIPGLSDVVAVSMGDFHGAAITSDGSLYIWGFNSNGELGFGDTVHRNAPTKVPGLSDVAAISMGTFSSTALTADGSLYTWGQNRFGELGLGDSGDGTDRTTPTKVGLSGVVAIVMGEYHCAAVTTGGNLYSWGLNDRGQLALGDKTDRDKPTFVMTDIVPFTTVDVKPFPSMSNFKSKNTYTPGQFTDVNEDAWYGFNQQKVIAKAYEYGLMKGTGAAKFNPQGNFTIAEAITVAARVHSVYMTGTENFTQGSTWYQVYVDYAVKNGIIKAADFSNYNTAATRAQMAYIFARCLPADEYPYRWYTKTPPDVTTSTPYYGEINKLYEAGIVGGSDDVGTFRPGSNITRAEAAAILARLVLAVGRLGTPPMPS